MPRILPRLIKALRRPPGPFEDELRVAPGLRSKACRKTHTVPPHKQRISIRVSRPAAEYSRSLLLDEESQVRRRKGPSPVVRYQGQDGVRFMNEDELRWWSNSYLRMMASPLRMCQTTGHYMPSDFLVRVARLRLDPELELGDESLLPDGIQHPEFQPRRAGKGHYVICNKQLSVFDRVLAGRGARKILPHSRLKEQIGHLLRLRILQELEILARRARPKVKERHTPIIRRLTRAEWKAFQKTETIPNPGVIAVLVVPPVKKSLLNGGSPDASPNPTEEIRASTISTKPPPPLSVLYPATTKDTAEMPGFAPHEIPLYNSISLFPSPTQRAALHQRLCVILKEDTITRWNQIDHPEPRNKSQPTRDEMKSSHAFLVYSDGSTVRRVDTVPLAIALWRLRMWEMDPPATIPTWS
ncbi:hypothetical protein BDM02DRAFT_3191929 [Thelephora ganbajun]|uniref:Uncharacterized protein n=1 Tax=Thelephora ganbajun TaxID=370292 RepID=A0ACB6Z0X0_THEGA|nr:hypothetical protein BDM02DRAFT_3191929 [Thelephora ganbajun]